MKNVRELVKPIIEDMNANILTKAEIMEKHSIGHCRYTYLLNTYGERKPKVDKEALISELKRMTVTGKTALDIAAEFKVTKGYVWLTIREIGATRSGEWPIPHYLDTTLPTLPNKPQIFDFDKFCRLSNYSTP